ncbi:MAG: ankyrin repeat domain-containing protein [Legionellaceae bacterium]|nr:ankyrin repeat domain-containing protein [Legionellaceae bacterium]
MPLAKTISPEEALLAQLPKEVIYSITNYLSFSDYLNALTVKKKSPFARFSDDTVHALKQACYFFPHDFPQIYEQAKKTERCHLPQKNPSDAQVSGEGFDQWETLRCDYEKGDIEYYESYINQLKEKSGNGEALTQEERLYLEFFEQKLEPSRLFWAAKSGDLAFIKQKLDRAPLFWFITLKDKNGFSMLDWAKRNQHQAMLEYVLERVYTNYNYANSLGAVQPDTWSIGYGIRFLHLAIACQHQPKNVEKKSWVRDLSNPLPDELGNTLLHYAARNRDLFWLKTLLKNKTLDIEAVDAAGNTPLLTAAQLGNWQAVDCLIAAGAKTSARNTAGKKLKSFMASQPGMPQTLSALHLAAKYFSCKEFYHLTQQCQHASLHERGPGGFSLLHYAIQNPDAVRLIQFLINHNVDMQHKDAQGRSACFLAMEAGRLDLVRLMLNQGSVLFSENNKWMQELYLAVPRVHSLFVSKLSAEKNGAFNELCTATDINGHTPLQRAVLYGRPETVAALLALKNTDNKNLLHLAARSQFADIEYLWPYCGADKESVDTEANTPLHLAVMNGHTALVFRLLKEGVRWDVKNQQNKTAMALAKNCPDAAIRGVFKLQRMIRDESFSHGLFGRKYSSREKLDAKVLEQVILHGADPDNISPEQRKRLEGLGGSIRKLISLFEPGRAESSSSHTNTH